MTDLLSRGLFQLGALLYPLFVQSDDKEMERNSPNADRKFLCSLWMVMAVMGVNAQDLFPLSPSIGSIPRLQILHLRTRKCVSPQ